MMYILLLLVIVVSVLVYNTQKRYSFRISSRNQFGGRCEQILRIMREGAILISKDGRVEFLNPAAQELLGCLESKAVGSPYGLIYNVTTPHGKSQDVIGEILKGSKAMLRRELLLTLKDGEKVSIVERVFPIFNFKGEVDGALCLFYDRDKKIVPKDRLEELTFKDALTGLYNRAFFEVELPRLDNEKYLPLSIMVGDMDGMKLTNDIFGHQAGDKLLQMAAEVFKSVCRPKDRIFRWGGDEFVVLMPNTTAQEASQVRTSFLKQAAQKSVGPVTLHIALGYATKEEPTQNIHDLWQMADEEMFWSKSVGSGSYERRTLENIAGELFARSSAEKEHANRVSKLAEDFGAFLGLSEADLRKIRLAGKLHDIGKIALEPELLHKPYPLSKREQREMQRHPLVGFRLLNFFGDTLDLADAILAHHERWDGEGYPRGLRGKEIPLLGRILAIVETYDRALFDPFSRIHDQQMVLDLIKNGSGSKFDPSLVEIFLEMMATDDRMVTTIQPNIGNE